MQRAALLAALAAALPAIAEAPFVPNPSFEAGAGDRPEGWTLEGTGRWLDAGAADGSRAVAVGGRGEETSAWRSGPLSLQPGGIYRLAFRAKKIDGGGGTPVTGPWFCNRDLGEIPAEWTPFESVFVAPAALKPADAWIRFGQWHVKGTVAFDAVELHPALPVHARAGGLVLGEGERVRGAAYDFEAPFHAMTHHSRPLAGFTAGFNSNRWTLGGGQEVVYRHVLGDQKQTAAEATVSVIYHTGGELAVEASTNGTAWQALGTIPKLATQAFKVPAALLPAGEVWIRLRASAKANLQVGGYGYRATLDTPAALAGSTRYVSILESDPRVAVDVEGLGEGLPGGDNVLVARVRNTTAAPIPVEPSVTVENGGAQAPSSVRAVLVPGEQTLRIPYTVPGPGANSVRFALGGDVRFRARTAVEVAGLHAVAYGEQLPASGDHASLWWCSSGWKVSRTRPAPRTPGEAIRIRAARNEVEAAQVVVRPGKPLQGLTALPGPLAGPDGAAIPAAAVEILKVRYVDVERPTDATGCAAPWPDPLPPLKGPVDLEPGRNQPFWVRVKVPRDAKAGTYAGTIALRADGWTAEAPLRVEVYDFVLPDRMTCESAFGFSPGNVWRYQRLQKPEDRRAVLEKYWENFSAHHIAPYDPAPLDPLKVMWPKAGGGWEGGEIDKDEKHGGQSSLKLADANPKGTVSARYAQPIPIPAGGLKLRFWYKTAAPGHPFIVTLNHHDAAGDWMSGRNNDMAVEGNGQWQSFERAVTSFPEGAKSVRLTLWATRWSETGVETGTVWFDDLSLQDAATGKELAEGGAFEPRGTPSLVPSFDWTAWDAALARAFDRFHFSSLSLHVPGMGGGSFHERWEPELLGYKESTPEYKTAFTNYLRAVETHLKEKGWLDKTYVYWFDEPDPKDYAFVMNGFRKLKEAAPGIRRMLTEQVEPGLVGGPNLWCPISDAYDHARAEERRQAGEHFWWYVCTGPKAPYCTLFIDHPATELRVWLWQTWQRKIEGVLVWETNYWTSSSAYPDKGRPQNPYEDPMGWVSGYSTPEGTKSPWGNGDGRFIYPPEAAADANPPGPVHEGPVDSIRWEMLRDGIEDYEYLAMLKRLLAAKGASLPAARRAELEALLEVPPEITKDVTTFTKDPAPVEARRHAVAKAIEALGR
jgi:hypothetical protein